TIRLCDAQQRDALRTFLKERGIPSMVYYPRGIHQQSAFADRHFADALFPRTLAAAQQVLSLPMHPYLTDEELNQVADAVEDFFKQS
ncbi:MAG: DegT/DnrJ/EryC1/StrS family aminotransferase, partial [Eubacteriales bacterium]|nr:DegT/DnrJ/EryC1/StrS family aminotransferase [Eubacteriales bacterium]